MTPLKQVKLLWLSLAILFFTILFILLRIEMRIDELQLQMDRIERRR